MKMIMIQVKFTLLIVIDAAWAVDANGNDVDTYYVVNENILTQVVNFDEKTQFPVIADPSAWKIAKCAAAIGLIVAGTVIAAAKVAKVVKYIKKEFMECLGF